MSVRISALDARDAADLDAKRRWVMEHYDDAARHQYDTLDGKLRLLATILDHDWVAPAETLKLHCLGVSFGDALAQRLGLEWVMVDDEFGRDPALQCPTRDVRSFPLSAIAKRIERGERVDIHALFEAACAAIERARRDADPAPARCDR